MLFECTHVPLYLNFYKINKNSICIFLFLFGNLYNKGTWVHTFTLRLLFHHVPPTFLPRSLNNSSVLEIQLQRAQNSVRARSKFSQSTFKIPPERAQISSRACSKYIRVDPSDPCSKFCQSTLERQCLHTSLRPHWSQ